MSYKALYANKPLHDYLNIYSIKRTILPTRENSSKKINGMNGEYYINHSYGTKKITLNCGIIAKNEEHYKEIVREISYLLDVDSPKELIISDMPDRKIYAVIDGDTNLEKKFKTASFNLEFVCFNPYEYAIETKNTLPENNDEFDSGLINSNKHLLEIENNGSADTFPIVNASFYGNAHFFQCSNKGRIVLIGAPPSVDLPTAPETPIILDDKCTSLEGWNNTGNVLDGDVKRVIDGSLGINKGGYAITCANYGSGNEDTWHGGAGRKNLTKQLTDFKIEIDVEHASGGTLKTVSSSSGSSADGNYKITAHPSLNVRSGRGTSYKIVTSIPKGKVVKVTSIQNKWGKVTYNGKTGYIYMSHTSKVSSSSPSPPSPSSNSYKTTARVNLRSGRGTKYKSYTVIPNGKTLTITDVKSDWGKTYYNGKTGYVYMRYVKKISSKMVRADETSEEETREDRMGRCEIYLFDTNGQKIAKVLMRDSSSYYEYSQPEMFIGSKLIIHDNLKTPKAKTVSVKENDKTISKKIDSGSFGVWNEFDGKFTIERKTEKGKQIWNLRVVKYGKDGKIERKLEKTGLCDSSYPTGKLSNIVIWFGAYGNNIPVDVQNVTNIKVTDISKQDNKIESNIPIFKSGDELKIDFESQEVMLNREEYVEHLDIGSEFFNLESGHEKILCVSDTNNMTCYAEYRERWL